MFFFLAIKNTIYVILHLPAMNNIAIPFVETNICKALDKLITACSNNQKDLISVAAKTCLEELKKYQNADANADGGNLQISNQRQLIDFDFKG